MLRNNISEEYRLLWVVVQEKLFHRSRQGFLNDKLLKKLGITQCVIKYRGTSFLSASVATV